jgi:hypothetical protein
MAMAISLQCSIRCAEHRVRAKRPTNMRRAGARLAALAAVVAALVLVSVGEHWLLRQAPATPSELAAATYAAEALVGSAVVQGADANDIPPGTNGFQPEDKDIAR